MYGPMETLKHAGFCTDANKEHLLLSSSSSLAVNEEITILKVGRASDLFMLGWKHVMERNGSTSKFTVTFLPGPIRI